MKNISIHLLKFVFGLILISFVFVSCDKDDDDDDEMMNPSEFLTAKIDGVSFEADALTIASTLSTPIWTVQGNNATGTTIRLTVQNYSGVGTYNFGGLTNPNTGVVITDPIGNPLGWTSFGTADNSGSVTVTSDDGTTVEGTFAFEGVGGNPVSTKLITEGTFKATIE